MSFSKEDKKKVFDFFEKLLLEKFHEPVYYEQLRGYVSNAEDVVRKYVSKECKGEKLLHFFQTRKNYFYVNFRNEVMLLNKRKSVKDTISEVEQHITKSDDLSYEELTSSDYFNCSRSTSVSSRHGSEASSVDDVFVDADISEKSESETSTLMFFRDYLEKNVELYLYAMDIRCLPKSARRYVTKHYKKDFALFFKKYPQIFHIDEKNCVSLVSAQECHDVTEEETPSQDDDIVFLHNFVCCADFFVSILKKRPLPVSYLSGYLSRAKPGVSGFLKLNYSTFKDFLIDADKLFVFNDYDEVGVTKDGPKLLRDANRLLDANSAFSPQALKHEIYSYLKSGISKKQNSLSDKDQVSNCSDTAQLEISTMESLNEEKLHLNQNKKLKVEKPNISDEENVNIEIVDYIESKSDNIHPSKKKKLRAEKLNIAGNENINVNGADSHKTLEDKFKDEPNIPSMQEGDSVADVDEEFDSEVSGILETFLCDKITSTTQRNFIECIFTIQLLILEIVEKQLILCYKYEYEAVKHFVDILGKFPGIDIIYLKGSLGQAPKDVNSFMNTLYKGDKINLFFKKHSEFKEVVCSNKSTTFRLSPTYKKDLEDKRKLHELFVAGTKAYDVNKLYDSQLHSMFIDALECLNKICCFLQNKSKIKLTRLSSVFPKFSSSQQSFVNSLNGTGSHEKLEKFLCYFNLFCIEKGCIELDPEHLDMSLFINSITEFTQKLNSISIYEESKVLYFDYLLDYLNTSENQYPLMNFDELKACVIERVHTFLTCFPNLEYSSLPNVVGYEILHSLVLEKKDSQFLIQLLEENTSYSLNDGMISHRNENDKAEDFISDSNTGDKQYSEDSSEKSLPAVVENIDTLHEKKKQIPNDGKTHKLANIILSLCENSEHVNEIHHEDSKISLPNMSLEDDLCVEKNKTINQNLTNEDSEEVLFNKNTFCDQQQDRQSGLNHENKLKDMSIKKISTQGGCNNSDIPSSDETDDNNTSLATKLNKEVGIISGSDSSTDSAVTVGKHSINELNNEKENTHLTVKQKDSSDVHLTVSSTLPIITKSPKPPSAKVDFPKVWKSLRKPSVDIVSSSSSAQCDRKLDSNCKKYTNNTILDKNSSSISSNNIKTHPIFSASNHNSNNEANQFEASKTEKESVTGPTYRKSSLSNSDSIESDSDCDKPRHNLDSTFLRSLQAKIIILTLDSCIAETVVNGRKKCVFCLKSCFHCDFHSDCTDCFNLLAVGDEILCYIPPTEDLNCGNMCFAFKFHKDLETGKNSKRSLDTEDHQRNYSNHINQSKYSSSIKDRSDSDEVQVHHLLVEEISKNRYSLVSQNIQTTELPFENCLEMEKESQVKRKSLTQITQTIKVTSEVESQTLLAGEVKSCVPICEKACLTKFPTVSQNTQAVPETFEHGSQTDISGNINPQCDTSACECQTILTGQVRKTASVTDVCCQTLFSRPVAETTQTDAEDAADMTSSKKTNLESRFLANIPCDPGTGARSKHSFLVPQKEFCDTSCQTRSTGAIMMRALYHDDEQSA